MSARRASLVLAIAACALMAACASQPRVATAPQITVYFSPHGGCTEAIVCQINAAKESVLVQAYSFTSAPIAKALMEAHRRGVDVQVILDKSQRTEKHTLAPEIKDAGIPTFIDPKYAIAHNKVMVIDGHIVITGSFNFTRAAEEANAENLLVIDDAEIAGKYTRNWLSHLAHSTQYEQMARDKRE